MSDGDKRYPHLGTVAPINDMNMLSVIRGVDHFE